MSTMRATNSNIIRNLRIVDGKGVRVVETKPRLPLRTAEDLHNEAPKLDFILNPWLPKGSVIELIGTQKESGKSTFARAMIRDLLRGKPFLGSEGEKLESVLYLTEEPVVAFNESLLQLGFQKEEREKIHVLQWYAVAAHKWSDVCRAVSHDAQLLGAPLVVIDTLPQFALQGQNANENDSAQALQMIRPLQKMAHGNGLTVLSIRHSSKSTKKGANAGRGSSATAAAVDVLYNLINDKKSGSKRELEAMSRFSSHIPAKSKVDFDGRNYWLCNSSSKAKGTKVRDAFADGSVLSMSDLIARTGLTRGTIQRELKSMNLVEVGEGTKASPKMWHI